MATPQNSGNTPARPNEGASTIDSQLDAAVAEAGTHPERAAALAADLGIGDEQPAATPEDDDEYDSTFEEDSVRFYTASSIHQTGRDVVLEAGLPSTLLLSVIWAFCSEKDAGEYDPVPVYALPAISGRAANKMLFYVDGRVHGPTLTGFRFTRWDKVEVDPKHSIDFDRPGALVVGIVDSNLRLLELREDDESIIRLYDLHAGKMLNDNMHLLIGGVTEIRHHYEGPQTARDRAFDKALDSTVRERRNAKHDYVTANPAEFEAKIEQYMAEEAAAGDRSCCGAQRGLWICNLAASHGGPHEAWGEGSDGQDVVGLRWSDTAAEQGGAL